MSLSHLLDALVTVLLSLSGVGFVPEVSAAAEEERSGWARAPVEAGAPRVEALRVELETPLGRGPLLVITSGRGAARGEGGGWRITPPMPRFVGPVPDAS